jgi:hypothetical protein
MGTDRHGSVRVIPVTRAVILSLALLVFLSRAAAAQPYIGSSSPRAGSLEIGGSVAWTSGYDAGDLSAFETPNGGTDAPLLTLFTTSSKMRPAAGAEGRLAVYLSSRVAVEGNVRVSRPTLETRIADDFENADPATAEETVSSYLLGGTLLYHFGSGAFVPFVSGGGSYLRELHEDNSVVLTGAEIHGGGGVKFWFGNGAHRFGLRIDAQASSRSKSIGFEEKRRLLPVFGAGVSYLF